MATHLYSVVLQKETETFVVGLFSNKKNLFESLDKICDLTQFYIIGERKRKLVNHSTLSTSFNNGFLKLYDVNGDQKFLIWDLTVNEINPQLLNKEK